MDHILTEKIGAFLKIEKPTDQEIIEAATMLLQCDPNRERGIYNSARIRPQYMLPWVRADLKKYYGIRQRGLTTDQVPSFNDKVVSQVRQTLSQRPETVDEEKTPQVPVLGVLGRREDHDQLPEAIRKLWENNAERWKKIRQLHNQLLVMISKPGYQPCDGNELCHTLREADTQLRKDYQEYDSYVIHDGGNEPAKDSVDVFTDNVKTIQNARTALSRGLARKTQDESSLKKLRDAVSTLKALKQDIKPETVAKLKAIGVDA